MVGKVHNLKTVKSNPYFKLDFKRVDNSLEEAILPHHDQVTLSYVTQQVNAKGYAIVKGKYGDADVELYFSPGGYGTLAVSGHVGSTPISELVALGVSYGPVKQEVIQVNGKQVTATTQTATAVAFSSRETVRTIMNYSSNYSVKTYRYVFNGKPHTKAEGEQHIDTELYIAQPQANEAELTTTKDPYHPNVKTEMMLKYMDNRATLKGRLFSIRFKDNRKIAGKQHKIEVQYSYHRDGVSVRGYVYNIYKPEENLKFFYIIT